MVKEKTMAFSPLPRDYSDAIREINMWRASYKRQAQSNAAHVMDEDNGGERAEKAEAENAALRDDAERYRFLRQVNAFAIVEYSGMFGPKELKGKKLDKAIDAAREKTRKK